MAQDAVNLIYKDVFGFTIQQDNINKIVKAVILNFGDERGDIVVTNDNFGTRRKYADFTNGKKNAGLHPYQIVFTGFDVEHITHGRYIGADDQEHEF